MENWSASLILYMTMAKIIFFLLGFGILGFIILTGSYSILYNPSAVLALGVVSVIIPLLLTILENALTLVFMSDSWAPFTSICLLTVMVTIVWILLIYTKKHLVWPFVQKISKCVFEKELEKELIKSFE